MAGPPSPLEPKNPFPATVVIIPVEASTRRSRALFASATKMFPRLSNANLTFFPVGGREIALDSLGNIFVADANNPRLRRVDASTGIITTVAGNGFFGSSGDGGPAINSEVDAYGVALDSAGSIFLIKDSKIRRIDASTGIIQTFAGTGQLGSTGDGGPATMALLDFASGLVADSVGNVFIAENNGCHVRRVDSTTRIISTVAGNGTCGFSDASPATNAYLAAPNGLAFNNSGNLFIADSGNTRIRRLASDFNLTAANGLSLSPTVNPRHPATF